MGSACVPERVLQPLKYRFKVAGLNYNRPPYDFSNRPDKKDMRNNDNNNDKYQ